MSPRRDAEGTFLLEIGTEEIPARMVQAALDDLGAGLFDALGRAGLVPEGHGPVDKVVRCHGTPRRLAALVRGLLPRQKDVVNEITGPPVKAAFDASGRPTRAAEGFARAQGVEVSELRRVTSPKGECVAVRKKVVGRNASDVLANTIPPLVTSLYFPKTMRWGSGEHRFVRPIHTVVALLDDRPIEMVIAGVHAGRETRGHRFAGKQSVRLKHARDYVDALRASFVLVDVDERRGKIAELLEREASRVSGRIAEPPGHGGEGSQGDSALLEEVTHLVEWPTVISGQFERAFLELPQEVLVTAMRHHQKYFSLRDGSGKLLNRFLAVADCEGDPRGAIRKGNEWVLRARLADARFFWDEDRKSRLEERSKLLERVTFHEKLGSYAAKTARMSQLARRLIAQFERAGTEPDPEAVARGVTLCKHDLTTQMVNEFPELEGIVGGLYAAADGLARATADAIYSHYLPRGTDDALPSSPEGAILSLADRLDSQAGIFLLGIIPTGSRDPYGLRRSVQGVCRILIEKQIPVSLSELIDDALAGYEGLTIPDARPRADVLSSLLDFYRGRLQFLGEESGLRRDSVRAALAASCDDPHDARARMRALDSYRSETGFLDLAAAHKRIKNILQGQEIGHVDPEGLREPAERALYEALESARVSIEAACDRGDYIAALKTIGELRPALDRFFDEVMVMDKNPALRANRVALLSSIAALFLNVGDFSLLAVEAEANREAARSSPA